MSDAIILGAVNPEMRRIEALARECGLSVHYATAEGTRVHPGNAYRADGIDPPLPDDIDPNAVIAVECDGPAIPAGAVRVDHHRPGDPGYGRPPEEFLPASSIGQVIQRMADAGALPTSWEIFEQTVPYGRPPGLNRVWFRRKKNTAAFVVRQPEDNAPYGARQRRVPRDLVLAAAADHCLAAAYRGECPGVDPGELMRWRGSVRDRAAFERRSEAAR